jgi:hypothetical protein
VKCIEENHRDNHEHRVKDIKGPLLPDEPTSVALSVLHEPEDGSDEDQYASAVQHHEISSPIQGGQRRFWRWRATHTDIEMQRDDNEQPEGGD